MLDPERCIVSWNPGAERIKGYKSEEIIDEQFSRFYTEEDVKRGHPEEELRIAAEQGTYEEEGGLRVRKDGSRFWANVVITALKDEKGHLYGFTKVTRDITERKEAQEALLEIREAERRRIARDLHDVVLQDLASVLQALQLTHLRSKGPGLELEAEIEALRRAARGLRSTIYDLRFEKKQPSIRSVESLVELNRQMTPERDIKLLAQEEFAWEELSERVGVELLRVIQEALTNARRHSSARRVEVHLQADRGEVRAEVLDDGRGFEAGGTGGGRALGDAGADRHPRRLPPIRILRQHETFCAPIVLYGYGKRTRE